MSATREILVKARALVAAPCTIKAAARYVALTLSEFDAAEQAIFRVSGEEFWRWKASTTEVLAAFDKAIAMEESK